MQSARLTHLTPTPTADAATLKSPAQKSPRRRRAHLAIGIVLVCGAVCLGIGAYFVSSKLNNKSSQILSLLAQTAGLRVVVQAKRASMQINGLSTAEVFLFPRATAQALEYDAYLAVPVPESNSSHVYTFLDNKAYWVNLDNNSAVVDGGCLAEIPPVHLSSLANSRVVDQVSSVDTDIHATCANNDLLELEFAGETFVLCNSPKNQLTKIVGQDVDMTVEYVADPTKLPELAVPIVNGKPLDCPAINSAQPSSSHESLSSDISAVVTGAPRTASLLETPTCSGCRLGVKPCLFVHGVGGFEGDTSESYESYWGRIGKELPCCSSVHFAHIDLVNQRWDERGAQSRFCDVALSVTSADCSNSSNSSTIGSVSLIAHSMGNLVIGAALANNVCSFSSQVSWYSLAAPMGGSKSANMIKDKCSAGSWLEKPLQWLGQCPVQPSFASLLHETTVDDAMKTKFQQAQDMRRRHVTKVLCGTSPGGLVSSYSPQTLLVGALSKHDSKEHDGVVDFPSCTAGLGEDMEFGTTIDSANYKGHLNHADCAFRYGDGWWGSDRKPVKWLQCAM